MLSQKQTNKKTRQDKTKQMDILSNNGSEFFKTVKAKATKIFLD
jgi:hypothetical protein